ncbi:hypothetical protein T05_8642 [Trichinella murrelli]|uniref:Uncharacterized protein n=1 Tax=Trichinella murrelli TaxID=144512 RepID=A0A0V0TF43_9BILA|nr:hypothetical protein T05_8642 [Trichinella murrelli]
MSNYWANAWYLFESLETSNSLYGETYSMLLRNYGILKSAKNLFSKFFHIDKIKASIHSTHLLWNKRPLNSEY